MAQHLVEVYLGERQPTGIANSITATFVIEAEDASAAAVEANRLAADFAAAVPFVAKEYRVNVAPFRR